MTGALPNLDEITDEIDRTLNTPILRDAEYHLSDLGNAQRLVAAFGADMRYCEPLGGWRVWDGRRWAPNETGQVERMAQKVTGQLLMDAVAVTDLAEQRLLTKHALGSESAYRQRAMLTLAQSQEPVAVRAQLFDADPWLLNVANGILDLRTGELGPHRRDAMATKLAPVVFDPDAQDPVFEQYLRDATGGDADFAAYLQRAAGYTLTGLTDEEAVFLVLGPGATGKSTLVEALLATLGDYAYKASFETFLAQRHNGGPRPDLIRMRGARLVAAVESPRGRRLAEAEVKELAGGDSVTARDLYRSPVTFKPTFKLWLATNHAPTMDDDDTALWRRIRRLPFEHVVAEERRDPEVKRYLADPGGGGPAVLAWAVKGALDWQERGLQSCARVRRATAELRAEFDPIAEFLETCCVVGPGAEVPAGDLRTAYEQWASDWGAKPIDNREWGKRLRALGCESSSPRRDGRQVRVWQGIGLLTEDGVTDVTDEEPISTSSTNTPTQGDFTKKGVRV
jgi:putative DNA primase/helicase